MGICGTAMGNVAVMMKGCGHEVCGSDTGVYEPMKGVLERAGIGIFEGWDAGRLMASRPDLVVVGNVISRMNPEIEWLLDTRAFEFTSLAELIGRRVIGSRPSLVVSGTHGKTTTTSVAAHLLSSVSPGAGWLIGGVPEGLEGGGSRFGGSDSPFVIEGDEYDTAFFDKRSKFVHYRPRVLLINNVEFDHADIFRDLGDVERAFTHVRRIVPRGGLIVENGDDGNIAALEPTPWVERLKVGVGAGCDVRVSSFEEGRDGSSFEISHGGRSARIEWGMHGIFNARNAAMAACGAAAVLGLKSPLDLDLARLASFAGVRRRQELILDTPRVCAVEDFGHHPTAIAGTIESLRGRFAGFDIYACFEPRSNSARTNVFEAAFASSLSGADRVYVGAVRGAEKIAEGRRMDTFRLARSGGEKFEAFRDNSELLEKLAADVSASERNIVCVFFSNGSFDSIHRRFAEMFSPKGGSNAV